MKHDPKAFGRNFDRAGWYLRAQQERRRSARRATLGFAAVAVAFAYATGVAMFFGNEGATALFGVIAALALIVSAVANSEA